MSDDPYPVTTANAIGRFKARYAKPGLAVSAFIASFETLTQSDIDLIRATLLAAEAELHATDTDEKNRPRVDDETVPGHSRR